MLYTCCDIPALYTLDKRHCHFFRQIRIFAEIFKVSSAKRTSLNIHTGSKNHIFPSSSRLFSQNRSCLCCQISVPGCRQCTVTWKISDKIICKSYRLPGRRFEFLSYPHRSIGHLKCWNSKSFYTLCLEELCSVYHPNLLIQCQFLRQFFRLCSELFYILLIHFITPPFFLKVQQDCCRIVLSHLTDSQPCTFPLLFLILRSHNGTLRHAPV